MYRTSLSRAVSMMGFGGNARVCAKWLRAQVYNMYISISISISIYLYIYINIASPCLSRGNDVGIRRQREGLCQVAARAGRLAYTYIYMYVYIDR